MSSPADSRTVSGFSSGLDVLEASQSQEGREGDLITTPRKPRHASSGWQSTQKHEGRPPQRTPRFIFGSSNLLGPSSTPLFAATPRFAVPATEKREDMPGDEIHGSDAEVELTPERPLVRESPAAPARRLEIPDSEDEDVFSEGGSPSATLGHLRYPDYPEIYDIDDEYENPFPYSPIKRASKRRRLWSSPTKPSRASPPSAADIDAISSSPGLGTSTPSNSDPVTTDPDDAINSPPPRRMPSTPLPGASTQFGPPSSRRLLFNARETQNSVLGSPTSQGAAPALPNRPHFVLPLSPSRRLEGPGQLTAPPPPGGLFSPPSTRTGRPARPRQSQAPDYIPGGMAAQVRNWVLELNATRQVAQRLSRPQSGGVGSTQRHPSQLIEKYYFIAQIEEVATSLPPLSNPLITYSSGGLTTLRVSQQLPDKLSWCRKVLLFCAPGSPPSALFEQNDAPQPALQKGNWIGVRRGAVWDMAIDNHGHSDSAQDAALPEKWLVGAEWDILPAEYGLA